MKGNPRVERNERKHIRVGRQTPQVVWCGTALCGFRTVLFTYELPDVLEASLECT